MGRKLQNCTIQLDVYADLDPAFAEWSKKHWRLDRNYIGELLSGWSFVRIPSTINKCFYLPSFRLSIYCLSMFYLSGKQR